MGKIQALNLTPFYTRCQYNYIHLENRNIQLGDRNGNFCDEALSLLILHAFTFFFLSWKIYRNRQAEELSEIFNKTDNRL